MHTRSSGLKYKEEAKFASNIHSPNKFVWLPPLAPDEKGCESSLFHQNDTIIIIMIIII
jgi:hypothetical protein